MSITDPTWQSQVLFALHELTHTCRLPTKIERIDVDTPAFVVRMTAADSCIIPLMPVPDWMVQVTFAGQACRVLLSRSVGHFEGPVAFDIDATAEATTLAIWDDGLHALLALAHSPFEFSALVPA